MRRRVLLAALLSAALGPRLAQAAAYVGIWASGGCADPGRILVQWQVEIDPADTAGTASWYGFDVYRMEMASCGPWVRVTTSPIPRIVGTLVTSYSLYDAPPDHHAWDYQVRFVNATGVEVQPSQFCECHRDLYTACPWMTTPVTEGMLVSSQGGLWVEVRPCDASCYPGVGLDMPLPDDLVPLVGSGAVVRLYGAIGCGTEGCLMDATHHDLGACSAVPVRVTSWGRLKTIYR